MVAVPERDAKEQTIDSNVRGRKYLSARKSSSESRHKT